MIPSMPILDTPSWLADAGKAGNGNPVFPFPEILKNSLYYPSCGLDGDPIMYLSHHFSSFVYVDYGITADEQERELNQTGLAGYHIVLSRLVAESELTPNGYQLLPLRREDGNPRRNANWIKPPFARWTVFERDEDRDETHGSRRISLLHICADGVATYQALYHANQTTALGIAIIQPGSGYGGNWTDFRRPERIFGRCVLQNPNGIPGYLLYGGIGRRSGYATPCWPLYSEHLKSLRKTLGGVIEVWRRPDIS